ncbi:hypothetical protein V1511DRAFT_512204 [Dipodascopsis uninucleata]
MKYSPTLRNIALQAGRISSRGSLDQVVKKVKIPANLGFDKREALYMAKVIGFWTTGATVFVGWTFAIRNYMLSRARASQI